MIHLTKLTPEHRAELEQTNTFVNKNFKYVGDREQYGRDDYAVAIDEGGGDCEDYGLRKRDELIKLGWDPRSLNMVHCTVPGADGKQWGHAVLCVHGTDEDLI